MEAMKRYVSGRSSIAISVQDVYKRAIVVLPDGYDYMNFGFCPQNGRVGYYIIPTGGIGEATESDGPVIWLSNRDPEKE